MPASGPWAVPAARAASAASACSSASGAVTITERSCGPLLVERLDPGEVALHERARAGRARVERGALLRRSSRWSGRGRRRRRGTAWSPGPARRRRARCRRRGPGPRRASPRTRALPLPCRSIARLPCRPFSYPRAASGSVGVAASGPFEPVPVRVSVDRHGPSGKEVEMIEAFILICLSGRSGSSSWSTGSARRRPEQAVARALSAGRSSSHRSAGACLKRAGERAGRLGAAEPAEHGDGREHRERGDEPCRRVAVGRDQRRLEHLDRDARRAAARAGRRPRG